MELSLTFTLCLVVIICNCSWRTVAQSLPDSSTCQVEYIEQPPDQLQCNPYINAELRLECTVTAQPNQSPSLVWYRRQLVQTQQSQQQQEEEEQSHSRSKRSEQWIVEKLNPSQDVYIYHQVRNSPMSTAARSRLVLTNLGGSDSGEYYCVAQVDGVELAVPSDEIFLREPAFYSILGACTTTGALSKQEMKCADGTSSSVPDIGSQPTATPIAKDIATSSSSSAKPPTMTVSKPTSSETGSDGRAGVGATTSAVPNPIDKETTVDPTQAGNIDDSESVPAEEELIEGNPTNNDIKTDDDPNVLLELYIAIAILVIFGVIIMILIPITVWMCLKKRKTRKVEGIRRTRQNLQFASPHCSSRELQSPSVISQVASDYLVPQPSWRSHKQQVQPSDCQKPNSLQQSYEITLSYSHEYEDVRDIEEGTTQLDSYVNESSTVEILEAGSRPVHMGVYVNDGPVRMKRNAAYRLYSTANSSENLRRNGYCNEVTVSNPLNCLYTAQHCTNEQQSNLE